MGYNELIFLVLFLLLSIISFATGAPALYSLCGPRDYKHKGDKALAGEKPIGGDS